MPKQLKYSLIGGAIFVVVLFILVSSMGIVFNEIDPFSSSYNDEVFYLKQIQGIWENFYPRGYFGYNQQTAVIGTFGSWSFIIMYVYALFGWLFQWSAHAIYITNVVLVLLALCIITYFWRPKNKWEYGWLLVPFINAVVYRHIYSGMTEALFYSLVILIAFAIIKKDDRRWRIAGALMVVLSSLMRPYLILLIIPFFIDYNRMSLKKAGMCLGIISGTIGIYFMLNHFFTAPYLSPLLRVSEIRDIISLQDIIGSIGGLVNYVFININSTIMFIKDSMSSNDMVGIIYFLHYLTLATFAIKIVVNMLRKRFLWIEIIIFVIYVVSFIAIICLYPPYQGSRHVFIFVIGIWMYLLLTSNNYIRIIVAIIAVCLNMNFLANAYNTYPAKIDMNESYIEDISKIRYSSSRHFKDNTILYEYGVDNSIYYSLYYVESGLGVNLCMWDNIQASIDELNGGYVIVSASSPNNELLKDKKKLAKNDWFIIYQLHKGE